MSRVDPQINLRLPLALKARVKQAAEMNRRSVNSEIVKRIEDSFETSSTNRKEEENQSSSSSI